jgi:hypothetical protein
MSSPSAPDWFRRAIGEGLMRLYALSLPGYPAAETVKLTKAAWCDALWAARRWTPEDQGRLAAAFTRLATATERWPAPRALIQHLPARPEQSSAHALAYKPDERARANASRHIRHILSQLRSHQP